MAEIRKMTSADVEQCSMIYRSAYAAEPWKEEYSDEEISEYLKEFLNSDSLQSFVLKEDSLAIGLALTVRVPSVGASYLRIEDFCIGAEYQRKGYGSNFLGMLAEQAKKIGCDSILLGTQKGFPAYAFYLKNGFREIESALLFRNIDS